MDKSNPICQVCFFSYNGATYINQLITCKQCRRSAHRYCYFPSFGDKYFLCDTCEKRNENSLCYVCGNDGLLKCTEENIYAHPICLILSKYSLVKNYKNLIFNFQKSKRIYKLIKCNLCSNPSHPSDLMKCFDRQCNNYAHYYCILKELTKVFEEDAEQKKWVQDMRIFESKYIDFEVHFQEKVKRYIRNVSIPYYKAIYGDEKLTEQNPMHVVHCQKHCDNASNCFCQTVEEEKKQRDWIYCDSCGRWYHFQCEQITDRNKLDDQYICKPCKAWHGKIRDRADPIIKNFPKLHFYDFVYIQIFCENKNYRLSNSLNQLLKRVPFVSSIKYFNAIIKNKEMTQKIAKNINFMGIKKITSGNEKSKKEAKRNLNKLVTDLSDYAWRMDFVINNQPIQSINKGKNNDYKFDDIINIFQKFEKRYIFGAKIMKPAIKQLLKLKNNEKKQEEIDDDNEISQTDISIAVKTLKQLVAKLKTLQLTPNPQYLEEVALKFYKTLKENSLINEVCKDYQDEKRECYWIIEPLFLYGDEKDMVKHMKIKYWYMTFSSLEIEGKDTKKLIFSANKVQKLYNEASKKVQLNNHHIFREVNSQGYGKQANLQHPKQKMVIPYNKSTIKHPITLLSVEGFRYSSIQLEMLEEYIQLELKRKWIDDFVKGLELKQSSLNILFEQHKKFSNYIKGREIKNTLLNYIQLFEAVKALTIGIIQGLYIEEAKSEIDMLQCIKSIKVDRTNIYKFCTFFISVCPLKLHLLNSKFAQAIRQKGIEYLNMIAARTMIFQSEIQFKAASHLLSKFNIVMPKLTDLFKKNRELCEMLKDIRVECLQNIQFYESEMETLREARQFCLQNDLEFRVSKIQYMMRLYQCKEEAFKYFPAQYIVKDPSKLPFRFKKIEVKSSVDFYLLKKFIYKIKQLKFPKQDHLLLSLNQLYDKKLPYFNKLTSIICVYNTNLDYPQRSFQTEKFKNSEILNLMHEKHKQFVTCRPEEQEISMIIDENIKLVKRLKEVAKMTEIDPNEARQLYKLLMYTPFQVENKEKFVKLLLKNFQKVEINYQNQHEEGEACEIADNMPTVLKRTQLDETNVREDYSNKSIKTYISHHVEKPSKSRLLKAFLQKQK